MKRRRRQVRWAAHWNPEAATASVYDPAGRVRATGIRSLAEASAVADALEAYDAAQPPPAGLEALDVEGAPV